MIILASTDSNELWTEMTERMLEIIAVFQMNGYLGGHFTQL